MNTQENEPDEEANHTTQKSELYSAFKPLFLFENINGIFRFGIKDGKAFPPSWGMKLYCIALSGASIAIFYLTSILRSSFLGESLLLDVTSVVPSIMTLTQYLTVMANMTFFQNETNIKIFNTFAELDRQLIKTDVHLFYQKSRDKNKNYLIFLIVIHFGMSSLDLITDYSLILCITFFLICKVELLTFLIYVIMLKSRLSVINGYLAKFNEERNSRKPDEYFSDTKEILKQEFNMIGNPCEDNMNIRDLAKMYGTVGNLCAKINSVHNFEIFTMLLCAFGHVLIAIWSSLYYFRTPEASSGPLISYLLWFVTTMVAVGITCCVCENLRSTRNDTRILVNRIIMDYDLPKTMRKQGKAFMELIEAWPLNILVYDMFSVNINMLLKFVSVSTTYLIIIIQLSHVG